MHRVQETRGFTRMGMAKFKRTFPRTSRNNLRPPHMILIMKMWGFKAKRPESSLELHHEHCHGISLPYSQRAQRSKKIDLDRNFQSRSKSLISLENFILDVSISPQKIGPRWVARSKISFSIEIFNLDRNPRIFLILGPSGLSAPPRKGS